MNRYYRDLVAELGEATQIRALTLSNAFTNRYCRDLVAELGEATQICALALSNAFTNGFHGTLPAGGSQPRPICWCGFPAGFRLSARTIPRWAVETGISVRGWAVFSSTNIFQSSKSLRDTRAGKVHLLRCDWNPLKLVFTHSTLTGVQKCAERGVKDPVGRSGSGPISALNGHANPRIAQAVDQLEHGARCN
jgi:hypothetical protein